MIHDVGPFFLGVLPGIALLGAFLFRGEHPLAKESHGSTEGIGDSPDLGRWMDDGW